MSQEFYKPKRRTIDLNLHRNSETTGPIPELPAATHPSETSSDIKSALELERERLRTLEKTAARSIVSAAEKSLLHLLKSKAQVSCLVPKESTHPFHMSLRRSHPSQPALFNQNLLTEVQGKRVKVFGGCKKDEEAPLIDVCRRSLRQKQRSSPRHLQNQMVRSERREYCGLIEQRRRIDKFYL